MNPLGPVCRITGGRGSDAALPGIRSHSRFSVTLTPPRRDSTVPRRYRPPIGIPDLVERNRWKGLLGSLGLHLLVLLIFILPVMLGGVMKVREHRKAGAAEVAGGGGGGRGGSGMVTERVFYVPHLPPIESAPADPPREVVPKPVQLAPPVPPPRPTPEPIPPVPPEATTPQPVSPPSQAAAPAASSSGGAPMLGVGGGSGNDGTDGSGPGRGGGVGSGVGTGRGSGVGAGTGVGADSIFPPTLLTLTLPPLDALEKIRPYRLVAYFDVDERGNTKLLGFNETRDSRFNRRVREVLGDVRFRPAVRLDGRPVRDTGRFEIEYP